MRILLFLFVLLLFLPPCSLLGQPDSKEKAINDIRKKYSIIEEAKDKGELDEAFTEYECSDYPESGSFTFYTDDTGVKLIAHSYVMGDHFGAEDLYYVWGGELFFLYSSSSSWTFDSESISDDSYTGTVDEMTETRHYFHKGEAIKCLEKNYKVRSSAKNKPTSATVPNAEAECGDTSSLQEKFEQILGFQNLKIEEDSCIWE
jgi:hypothetical protein